jgi:hypothetical protein
LGIIEWLKINSLNLSEGIGIYIEYSTIANNTATYGGGGFYLITWGTQSTISNCTISGNRAEYASACFFDGPNLTFKNTIFYNNEAASTIHFPITAPQNCVSYCDFFDNQGSNFGGSVPPSLGLLTQTNLNGDSCDVFHNIFLDPLFLNPDSGDYYLTENSPCIDAGDPASPLDPDSTIADMGAFYYHQPSGILPERTIPSPTCFALDSPAPNPFNPVAVVSYQLPVSSQVSLKVYDLTGRLVTSLIDRQQPPGYYEVTFDGSGLSSGLYFVRMQAGDFSSVRKMVLMK